MRAHDKIKAESCVCLCAVCVRQHVVTEAQDSLQSDKQMEQSQSWCAESLLLMHRPPHTHTHREVCHAVCTTTNHSVNSFVESISVSPFLCFEKQLFLDRLLLYMVNPLPPFLFVYALGSFSFSFSPFFPLISLHFFLSSLSFIVFASEGFPSIYFSASHFCLVFLSVFLPGLLPSLVAEVRRCVRAVCQPVYRQSKGTLSHDYPTFRNPRVHTPTCCASCRGEDSMLFSHTRELFLHLPAGVLL